MTDVEDVTAAADQVEAKLPHPGEMVSLRRGYSFADLISDLDKQALLEFGRNII